MLLFPYTVIDCFAGAGGLSLGLKQAGLDVRAAFDFAPAAVTTYRANIGPHVLEADAHDVTGTDLLSIAGLKTGECAIVTGGPPCQGFSAQRRGDSDDTRNDLIFQFLRIIEEISPAYFVMENVPTLFSTRGKTHSNSFLKLARDKGYRTYVRVLNAADYGVPQQRRRAFVVGERLDSPPSFEFPRPTHSPELWLTVRDAIGDLPSPIIDDDGICAIPNHKAPNISELNLQRISHVPPGGGREDIPENLRLPCHKVSVDKAGHRNVYGRLHWDRPAGTITTKCNSFTRGKFAHPEENRNITMREAARLQGFPDHFIFNGGTVPVAHQIGNAVPPPLARQLGTALITALQAPRTEDLTSDQLALQFG